MILAFPLQLVLIVFVAFKIYNTDPDLSRNRSHEVALEFEKELKGIDLPSHTGLNKFESTVKSGTNILVTQRYRTGLSDRDFLQSMSAQLLERQWVLVKTEKETAYTTFIFCRDKYLASLSRADGQGLWADGGTYWSLSISLGLPLVGDSGLPATCKK